MSRFKHIVEKFLTPEECKGFIDFSEKQGYQESLIRSKDGEVMNKDIRDNDRVIWDNPQVANQLWELVKDMMPVDIEGYEPTGLNERLRFYRYRDGQQFKPHIDGPYKKSETEKSKITLLLYLNEDFEGGNTTLVLEGEEIEPKEGMLFLFEHKIMHCGRPVTKGTKYVLRTDVMYRLKA
jgi:predicted 2-oxoglutarate/Fe(II)-dependent dioxygenase YbiX